ILLAVPASVLRDAKGPLALLVTDQAILYGGEDGDFAWSELLKGERITSLTAVTADSGTQNLTEEGEKLFAALETKPGVPAGGGAGVRPGGVGAVAEGAIVGGNPRAEEGPRLVRRGGGVRDGVRYGDP